MDTLANALTTMYNNEVRNKRGCIISPASKVIANVLKVFQVNGYIGTFEFIDDGRVGKFDVQLLGRINKCSCIKPRHSCKLDDMEIWEKRFLPSKDLGILILSTSKGVMSHRDAKKDLVGGHLLAYVY